MTIENKKKLKDIYSNLLDVSMPAVSQDEIFKQAVRIYLYERYYGEGKHETDN